MNKLTNKTKRKINRLVKLVSKTNKTVPVKTYTTSKDNEKTITLGYCYKGLKQHLYDQYEQGIINDNILSFLLAVNERKLENSGKNQIGESVSVEDSN